MISFVPKFKYFTRLHFPSAYHQINLQEVFCKKLLFVTEWGNHTIFRLRSATSRFQILIDGIREESNLQGVNANEDDFILRIILKK